MQTALRVIFSPPQSNLKSAALRHEKGKCQGGGTAPGGRRDPLCSWAPAGLRQPVQSCEGALEDTAPGGCLGTVEIQQRAWQAHRWLRLAPSPAAQLPARAGDHHPHTGKGAKGRTTLWSQETRVKWDRGTSGSRLGLSHHVYEPQKRQSLAVHSHKPTVWNRSAAFSGTRPPTHSHHNCLRGHGDHRCACEYSLCSSTKPLARGACDL